MLYDFPQNLRQDSKVLDKSIATIRATGAKMDKLIHETACAMLFHVSQHGDTTKIGPLLNAMPKSTRRKGLIVWFEQNGPMKIDQTSHKVTLVEKWKSEDFNMENAVNIPFWDLTPEKNPGKPDFVKLSATYLKKLKDVEELDGEALSAISEVIEEAHIAMLQRRLEARKNGDQMALKLVA